MFTCNSNERKYKLLINIKKIKALTTLMLVLCLTLLFFRWIYSSKLILWLETVSNLICNVKQRKSKLLTRKSNLFTRRSKLSRKRLKLSRKAKYKFKVFVGLRHAKL